MSDSGSGGETQAMQARIRAVIARCGSAWVRVASALSRYKKGLGVTVVLIAILLLAVGPLTLAAPQSCNTCHSRSGVYAQWRESSHSTVRCQACHTERGYLAGVGNSAALISEAWRTVFGGRGEVAWVGDDACARCHPEIGEEETFVVGTLRMSHVGLQDGGYRCTDCHADVAHALDADRIAQPTMGTCTQCHDGIKAIARCEVCHPDAAGEGEADRHDAEWGRTHGSNWEKLHGMGELSTCGLCHKPTQCEGCHGVPLPHDSGFAATHGQMAIGSRDPCVTCHTAAYCESCHGIEMPHPEGFLPGHPLIAQGLEDELCARCHTTANCNECHSKHVHPGVPYPMRPPKRDVQ